MCSLYTTFLSVTKVESCERAEAGRDKKAGVAVEGVSLTCRASPV